MKLDWSPRTTGSASGAQPESDQQISAGFQLRRFRPQSKSYRFQQWILCLRWIPVLMITLFFSCADDPVSQQGSAAISGTVMDEASSAGIANANVSTTPPTEAVVTDDTGCFFIQGIDAGEYTLRVSKDLYQSKAVSIEVEDGETAEPEILLVPSNRAPFAPRDPEPAEGALDVALTVRLSWQAEDPNQSDSLVYEVYFGRSGESADLIESQLADTQTVVQNLNFNSTYYWQVAAVDEQGEKAFSQVWNFTTVPIPDDLIAYASLSSDGQYEIMLTTADTLTQVAITHHPANDWAPQISPLGDKIAFVSNRDTSPHLYTMNLDGSNVKRISSLALAGYHNPGIGFSWTGDGQAIVFSHYERLYKVNADGSGLTQIANAPSGRHFRECSVSPNNRELVAVVMANDFYTSELIKMDLNGSQMKVLLGDSAGALIHPAYSPDGNSLAYVHDVSGYEGGNERMMDAHIYVINADGSGAVDLSSGKESGTNDLYPAWSGTGGELLFVNEANDGSGYPVLMKIQLGQSGRNTILPNGTMPHWR